MSGPGKEVVVGLTAFGLHCFTLTTLGIVRIAHYGFGLLVSFSDWAMIYSMAWHGMAWRGIGALEHARVSMDTPGMELRAMTTLVSRQALFISGKGERYR